MKILLTGINYTDTDLFQLTVIDIIIPIIVMGYFYLPCKKLEAKAPLTSTYSESDTPAIVSE